MLGLKIAIDLGSSNISVYSEDKGIVFDEPAVIICDAYNGKIVSMGKKAKNMLGKLPESLKSEYPIKDGVIGNYANACIMLKTYIDKICYGKLFKPYILLCVPSDITELDKKTICDAIISAGAADAYFVKQTIASAYGAGINPKTAMGNFICDIGGSNTDCAVVSMGDIVASYSEKIGGYKLAQSIKEYIQHEYSINIGDNIAEDILITLGSAVQRSDEIAMSICGQEMSSGKPVIIEINSTQIYWVLKNNTEKIISCIRNLLNITPPELSADLLENGIMLCGGASKLYGLDNYISQQTGLSVHRVNEPHLCAAKGMGKILRSVKDLDQFNSKNTTLSEIRES